MRDQYAGDVSDAIKFALLRSLAGKDRKLGVAWYYEPGDDGRPGGRHLEWLGSGDWKSLDAAVYTSLSNLPARSVGALEAANFWPAGTVFHRDPMPPPAERASWALSKQVALESADIIFLDPDNGIGRESTKHATMDEVRALRRPNRCVVFITFPGRRPYDILVNELHDEVREAAGGKHVMTLRTNVSVPAARPGMFVQRPRWFTIVDADSVVSERAHLFAMRMSLIPRVRALITGDG